jgi:ankyrin repeat protein
VPWLAAMGYQKEKAITSVFMVIFFYLSWLLVRHRGPKVGAAPYARTWKLAGKGTGPELLLAARAGSVEGVRSLLDRGAPISAANNMGVTSLIMAASGGYPAVVQELIERGAKVDARDTWGGTALISAAMGTYLGQFQGIMSPGHRECIFLLLKAKANVEFRKMGNGDTAFTLAARRNDLEAAVALLDAGSDINAYDKEGKTALLYTLEEGRKEMRDMLLARGADVNYAERDDNFGALMRAAEWGDVELAKILLDKGANVNAAGLWDRRTSLMRAAQRNNMDLVKLFCDKGANLDASHNDGQTALMMAAQEGHVEVVKELIKRGADLTVKNGWRHDGPTAKGLAEAAGKLEVVKVLEAAETAAAAK